MDCACTDFEGRLGTQYNSCSRQYGLISGIGASSNPRRFWEVLLVAPHERSVVFCLDLYIQNIECEVSMQ